MNPYDQFIINRKERDDPRFYLNYHDEGYKERIRKEGKCGDCFETNYKAFWDIYNETKNKNLKYVIGNLNYHKTGNQILHAFVLDGNDMIDRSQGKWFLLPFDEFRECQAEVSFSKVWDYNTIPRLEGIINRFGTYEAIGHSDMTWDIGIEKQIGSWDIAKLEVL
jgi:hypothetical protein